MDKKSARLTILIDAPTKEKLEALSATVDLTVSQILRKLIKNHLNTLETPIDMPIKETLQGPVHTIN
ncbi:MULTISPECIES: CopG family transcriptional regulator [Pseudomonas]|uniref:CopG family transcriptional regulator n=1 Tax=Pseudomonas TaxID=286 RepID=UPI00103A5BE2|nr:CopG family transcriptional regulator [Pseudomonas sp. D1HM]MBW0236642.1 hypothetical protein [Pseudomonas sp. D1HM]